MTIIFEVKNLNIQAENEDKTPVPIVTDVSFKVKKGEVVALIGESGSGKTTIALSAFAYFKPGLEFAGGQALLHGRDLLTMEPLELRGIRGNKVAYLAQSAADTFNPALTIGEQVTESAVLHGVFTQDQADERAELLYRALELPDPELLGKRYPHQVSGGQLQRLMAAMALCSKPDLLVLDEPTTALDVTTQIEVLKTFKKVIIEQNAAAIYVTHDLAVVAQIADHIVVLYNGRIKEQGSVHQVISRPSHNYTRRLMDAVRPTPASGQHDESAFEQSTKKAAFAMNDITAGYGKKNKDMPKFIILRDIDLKVENRQVVGVIGESGCGKSTLARVAAGLLPAAKGNIVMNDKPLAPGLENRSKEELRKIQFVTQMADTALNPKQKIGKILGRPIEFYFGLKGAEKENKVEELLNMVELPPEFTSRSPLELSGGQKQRINLARAIAANPEVIICDEVTSALDTIVGGNVIKLLKRLGTETGISFVFISHDLSTVASFADRIVVLYAGRVVEQGETDQVLSPPFHPYTKLLIQSVPELRVGWLEDTMETREALVGIAKGVEITAAGCPFYKRCPLVINDSSCDKNLTPPNKKIAKGHIIACHREISDLPG